MTEPGVDVVIAARNEARMLERCLSSLEAQVYRGGPIHVIVVDDHSTDQTARVAQRGGAQVLHSTKPGAGAARNTGIKAGDAPLVACLDAHSIPDPHWVQSLVTRFDEPRLGGCQARISNRSTDARVDAYLRMSGLHSNEDILEQTVSARRSLYPWLLTGNCIYRRCALEDVGYFDDSLLASEDVDLAWRIVLAGWILGYDEGAEVVHYDGNPWPAFLRKGWRYGRGAAQLTRAFEPHGVQGKFTPRSLRRSSGAETISNFYYWAGFTFERFGGRRIIPIRDLEDVRRFRDPFAWRADKTLRISPRTVYWFRDSVSVVVQLNRRERILLDHVGDFVWRLLVEDGSSRDEVIDAMVATYGIQEITASSDLDELIEEMIEVEILEVMTLGTDGALGGT